MYRGKRDSMLGIVVRQEFCDKYIDNSGKEWVEVFVPPRLTGCYHNQWGSMMVEPDHVCFIDDVYNEVFVNAGARIKIIIKNLINGRRIMGNVETDTSEMILGRFLQYERYYALSWGMRRNAVCEPDMTEILYNKYNLSGMKMYNYIINKCFL